jgi:hypothetical protein
VNRAAARFHLGRRAAAAGAGGGAEHGEEQPVVIDPAHAALEPAIEIADLLAAQRAVDGGGRGGGAGAAALGLRGLPGAGEAAVRPGAAQQIVGGLTALAGRLGRRRDRAALPKRRDKAPLPLRRPAVMAGAGRGRGREIERIVGG